MIPSPSVGGDTHKKKINGKNHNAPNNSPARALKLGNELHKMCFS